MTHYLSKAVLGVAILVAFVLSACQPTEPVTTRQVDLELLTHIASGMAEQDVFVTKAADAGEVFRITAEEVESYTEQPVYASQEAIAHDLFGLSDNPTGPYAQGAPMGFTMGEWLSATGSGTYTVQGDDATIDLAFTNLVPNGVYTLWCATVNTPPNVSIVDKPCGAEDGSENLFTADAEGNASFKLTMRPLVDTTETSLQVIAAAYHSDGQSYGSMPGDFGLNSHVQIAAIVPPPSSEAWHTVADGALTMQ